MLQVFCKMVGSDSDITNSDFCVLRRYTAIK